MSRARRHVISVSLFPFLAVLICIMGALVIILVLMVARVGNGAATLVSGARQPAVMGADEAKLRERLEDAVWKRDLLEKSRAEKTQELADKRAALSHLEDHIQRLNEQAKELLGRARSIDEGRQLRAEDLEKARQELAQLKSESAAKKKLIDDENKKQQSEEKWYALIPYDGPNGTRRRPIYIECTEIGITIQPEGLVFRAEDFQGPLGPGNPLDAALRTIRERLAQGGGKAGEPYPLLVVRPGGIVAYAASRAALKAWDDEFGYELIGDDKRLDYGEPDPAAAEAIERTIRVARQRQALLAAAMPRNFGKGDPPTSFADEPGTGGWGGGNAGGGSGGGYAQGGGGYGGSGGGTGGGGAGSSYAGQGGTGFPGAAAAPGGGVPGGGLGSGGSGIGGAGYDGGPGGSVASGEAVGSTGSGRYGTGSPSSRGYGTGGYGAGGNSAGGTKGYGPNGNSPGGNSGGGAGSYGSGGSGSGGGGYGGSSAGAAQAGSSGATGTGPALASATGSQSQPGVSVPVPSLGVDQGGSPSRSGSSGQSNGAPSGASGSPGNQRGGKTGQSNSSAKSRRPNWAVPNARVNSMGVTRPIYVTVLPDRLVIVPEKGDDRRPQQLPIAPRLAPQDVDAFVTVVQKEMKSWGLAVQNGFWKPQIVMEVVPGAEQQCSDLQMALEGSGFDLQRKLR